MNVFYEIISSLKETLQNNSLFSNIKFVDFPQNKMMQNPIKNVYAAFEIVKIQVVNGLFSNFIGENAGAERYGQVADVDVGIKICSPFNIGSHSCYDVFANICEVLLKSSRENFNIQSINSDSISYEHETSNFVLTCNVKISCLLVA